jgi:hypothetical protein
MIVEFIIKTVKRIEKYIPLCNLERTNIVDKILQYPLPQHLVKILLFDYEIIPEVL